MRDIIDRESGVKLNGHDDYPNLTIRFMRASLRLARAADGSNLRGTLFYNSPLFTKFSLGGVHTLRETSSTFISLAVVVN